MIISRHSYWSLTLWMALVYSNIPLKTAFRFPQPSQPFRQTTRQPAFTARILPHSRTTTRSLLYASKRRPSKRRSKVKAAVAKESTVDTKNEEKTEEEKESTEEKPPLKTYPARFLEDNGIRLSTDEEGRVHAKRAPILQLDDENNSNDPKSDDDDKETNGLGKTVEMQETSVSEASTEESPDDDDKSDGNQIDDNVNAKQESQMNIGQTEDSLNSAKPNHDKENTDVETSSATADAEETTTTTTHHNAKTPQQQEEVAVVVEEPITKVKKPPIFFKRTSKEILKEQPAKVVPKSGFNVVLTHCTADFDSLASAVGLAKLWASSALPSQVDDQQKDFDSASHVPTFVVLPRGAHPGVQRFLALHKHLFPIRSLRSLPDDLTGLNRLGLVDAQRRDRIGPAENLLQYANRVTVVDHHIDSDTDIPEASDYVVDQVGSVSTLIVERLQQAELDLTEAEATLLALGIHADTGSLCFDSTTPRDALSLAWVMSQGASQAAIAEHAQSSLSPEQQGVLTQALINTNSTVVHGVTLSTVLLSADGFINGLAAVTQDALELSSSDLFLLAVVYEAQSGGKRRSKNNKKNQGERLTARLLSRIEEHLPTYRPNNSPQNDEGRGRIVKFNASPDPMQNYTAEEMAQASMMFAEAWRGGEEAMRRRRLQSAFDRSDLDSSGFLELDEIAATLAASGIIASPEAVQELMDAVDKNKDGKVDFEEFVNFAIDAEKKLQEEGNIQGSKPSTMIIIGRVKAGVNMKGVKLNRLLERFGGGGHAKAASATVRLNDESEAEGILQGLVDEIIETSLQEQVTVGDFMTAPVLSVKPHMNEQQVEDLFTRYDVRALPVVDDDNEVIGLVTYKEVAAAKQRLWNKEQKRLRREKEAAEKGIEIPYEQNEAKEKQRRAGSTVKGWMKQHVRIVEDCTTMAELEAILLESDVGCIPVVAEGSKILIGMVTRTDLLRQHRYYPSLHYHNKGFADSISARKPIIELRKRLKKFDLENE
ncbi:phosphoesterase RecJ domain protein [Seminavis robusta]|uniref:Phosphoesterase RecJ domain protein n=1 Tax=Seminavis robusta TaxID=568900 RepID=A0A9N8HFV8_9STRA|nr:phosphoesterase RecJ domain protein [Seminavis robusta]|eukprot:Sro543_g163440.1 phosphoesterase RecJ domain protein (995) ;mRNA; r:6567-9658